MIHSKQSISMAIMFLKIKQSNIRQFLNLASSPLGTEIYNFVLIKFIVLILFKFSPTVGIVFLKVFLKVHWHCDPGEDNGLPNFDL